MYTYAEFLLSYRMDNLRHQARDLNYRISTHLHLSKVRPSKQSRAEQLSRAAYLTRQRDTLLNLYPEYFL